MSPDTVRKREREARHLAERLFVGFMTEGVGSMHAEIAIDCAWAAADQFMQTVRLREVGLLEKSSSDALRSVSKLKPAPTPLPSDGTPRMP